MRHLLHVLLSIAMWGLFAYYWHVVLGREMGEGTLRALVILGLVVVLGLAATVAWVGHNLRLARKFADRRRQVRQVDEPELARDTIGRPVTHPGLDRLRQATIVDVAADQETKTFTTVEPEARA